ncbi:hypothetical protein W97_08676 [Coniosporium apollinis CBS 100218]|uniref:Reticulon-like protein n=1 Tax=Coniosporium apollinis (strain CBS 100218) TaxID=1168221 RepID=R7Z655_CONA1|nr:uncharacterized protein W97_08676 [Coniosporium apollinis CBS 100218]EON69416.1 hypothetical protein W97_08676 [Coniosporium apollinis CBS 100218]
MNSVQNHPATQNALDTIQNGPVAQNVKEQSAKTSSEFRDLADARTTPDQPAATGQPLTHYHSMFYRLLSWRNPRATAISFLVSVLLIFATRYLPILRWFFKGAYIVTGITAAAEILGQAAFGNGFATQIRPRKYYTVDKASLERFTDDIEQLINFFVIEFQRIIFAENVYVTLAAFASALISYFLIKVVPLWGLSLIATSIIYLAPLIYVKNKDVIDEQLNRTGQIVRRQTNQMREAAAQQTSRATETVKTYADEYSHKAQDLIGQAKRRASRQTSPEAMKGDSDNSSSSVRADDFPTAPRQEPVGGEGLGRAEDYDRAEGFGRTSGLDRSEGSGRAEDLGRREEIGGPIFNSA